MCRPDFNENAVEGCSSKVVSPTLKVFFNQSIKLGLRPTQDPWLFKAHRKLAQDNTIISAL